MKMTNLCAGIFFVATSFAFGQQPPLTPQPPEDSLAAQQLVAWSRLQKPQPAPQPLPPRDTPLPQPDPQEPHAKPPADPEGQHPTTQTFTGKIVEDGGKYMLKVGKNTTYQLEVQADVKQYVNQDVKVIGNLDTGSNTIRVVKIELLS